MTEEQHEILKSFGMELQPTGWYAKDKWRSKIEDGKIHLWHIDGWYLHGEGDVHLYGNSWEYDNEYGKDKLIQVLQNNINRTI